MTIEYFRGDNRPSKVDPLAAKINELVDAANEVAAESGGSQPGYSEGEGVPEDGGVVSGALVTELQAGDETHNALYSVVVVDGAEVFGITYDFDGEYVIDGIPSDVDAETFQGILSDGELPGTPSEDFFAVTGSGSEGDPFLVEAIGSYGNTAGTFSSHDYSPEAAPVPDVPVGSRYRDVETGTIWTLTEALAWVADGPLSYGRAMYQADAETGTSLNNGAFGAVSWGAKASGDDLLDLTDPTAPVVIESGVYAISTTVHPDTGTMTAGGRLDAALILDSNGEGAGADVAGSLYAPAGSIGLSMVRYLPAGAVCVIQGVNLDGVQAIVFQTRTSVQRIA